MANLTLLVNAAESPDQAAAILAAAQSAGMQVRHVASADLEMPTDNARPPLWVRPGARQLEPTWGLDVIGGARLAVDSADQLAVRIGDRSALPSDTPAVATPVFDVPPVRK